MKNVLVLSSGGIDSTACLAYYKINGYSPTAVWVDYGQVSRNYEQKAIKGIASYFNIPLKTIRIQGLKDILLESGDEYRGRNLLLGSVGVSSFQYSHGLISMGLHIGTDYKDCSLEFQKELDSIVKILSDGRLAMDFPFGALTKVDIVEYCRKVNVPLFLTYSCLRGVDPECGNCDACQDRNKVISNENYIT